MEQLRKVLATIGKQLGGVSATTRLLLASLVVIMVMGLFLVAQYTSKPRFTPLFASAQDPAVIDRVVAHLETSGTPHEVRGGDVLVAKDDRRFVLSRLAEQQLLPADTSILFSNLLEKQTMWQTSSQHRQASNIALMNELSRWIAQWDGISKASVFIDVPERQGLGDPRTRGSASVTVRPASGSLSQQTVDAIAQFIAGAKAGLEPQDVRVIDASSGRQMRARTEDDALATTLLEQQAKVEDQVRAKIAELLAFIPGVTIAVTAQVDVTRSSTEQRAFSQPGEGSISLKATTTAQSNTSSSGKPRSVTGLTANLADDPTVAGGSTSATNDSTDEKAYENHVGYTHRSSVDPGGRTMRLAASISIPRGWYATIAPGVERGEDFDPTKPEIIEQVEKAFEAKLRPEIEKLISPHVGVLDEKAQTMVPGVVSVSLIPIDDVQALGAAGAQNAGFGGMLGTIASGGWIEKSMLAALALVSMVMMVSMVKKAGKKLELPPPEELMGIPPSLIAESNLVGEAGESDGALEGIEVGDDEFASQRMLEQIRDLAGKQPTEAAQVLRRWMSTRD